MDVISYNKILQLQKELNVDIADDAASAAETTKPNVLIVKDDREEIGTRNAMLYRTQEGKIRDGLSRNDGSVIYPVAGLGGLPTPNAPRKKLMALFRSWLGRENFVHTRNDGDPDLTTLFGEDCEADENNKFHADCSSFVSSVLMGITYDNSRYVRGKTEKNISYFHNNFAFPDSNYTARSKGGLYTFELAEYFAAQKRLFQKPTDLEVGRKTLRFGDIGFGVDSNDDHYYGIAHCFFILGTVNDKIIMAQCSSGGLTDRIEPSVFHWRLDYLGSMQLFARPDYGYDPYGELSLTKSNGATIIRNDVLTPGMEILLDNSGVYSDVKGGMIQYSEKFSACEDFIPVIPGSTVSFTGSVSNARGNFAARIHEYTSDFTPVRRGQTILVSGTKYDMTVQSNTRYIRPSFGWLNAAGNQLYFSDMDNFEITITPPSS